ncbi:hypothetical protein G3578_00450 [Brevibacillus sp. SYP-B805]|uniref:hypothetical protein n=1 Tax=Brevibacillus sp. SYP-B805 TaxID=1578199 RepID=UPI0013EC17EC|nr:hypothetical protein [Brevibacillus sp. SYP-B805]NGQ93637.1 hypothetical protein [Brevibacillus sp. SYP-B805]
MKRFLTCLLVAGLAISGVVPGSYTARLFGPSVQAAQTVKQRDAASVRKPIHQSIFFNDYQVVGLGENGWNWVKNDEFILPPQTPLDIDILQTTYGKHGTTVNRKKVLLDGAELTEYRSEITSAASPLEWRVPRFSIPANRLTPGSHLLTFIVEDGASQSSTVNVRFLVQQGNEVTVYGGTDTTGMIIPSGSTEKILAQSGSKNFLAEEQGSWKLVEKSTGRTMKVMFGPKFNTGTLKTGSYEVSFLPKRDDATEWKITVEVGVPPVYSLLNGNKQQLFPGQKITAATVPGTITFYADVPGNWSVSGTSQTAAAAQTFDVMIPELLRGMTITVSYVPEGGDESDPVNVQVDVPPGNVNWCDPGKAMAEMDILTRTNAASSYVREKEDLRTSDTLLDIYQAPLNEIWIATAADHFERGGISDAEEGPGIWAVNNVIADESRLNWDHTALNLASFDAGTYKVKYISKQDPALQWCGSVRIIEDKPPIQSAPSCEAGESGPAPDLLPLRLTAKNGTDLVDGGTITISDPDELEAYSALRLTANHVEKYGTKRIKKGSDSDRRYYTVPDVRWEYGQTNFGKKIYYDGATIFSDNRVELLFNGTVIQEMTPRLDGGSDTLNLQKWIERNDSKPGTYTLRITHDLSYVDCDVRQHGNAYEKDVKTVTKTQTFTTSIELKK